MSLITLQTAQSSCAIDTLGCGITKLILQDQEILWSGTRPDGGKGFTHPCIPNFNLAEGLPNHGPARKEEWQRIDESTFTWQMAEIPGVYTAGIQATRMFTLSTEQLSVTTEIANKGKSSLPINIAEHHYFSCPSELRSQVKVNGKEFDIGALAGQALYSPLVGEQLEIVFPQGIQVVMTVEGYAAFAQWSLPDAEFVCIEPIQIMPPEPTEFFAMAPQLQPEEKKIFRYTLSITKPSN